jgi:hypothetical protein
MLMMQRADSSVERVLLQMEPGQNQRQRDRSDDVRRGHDQETVIAQHAAALAHEIERPLEMLDALTLTTVSTPSPIGRRTPKSRLNSNLPCKEGSISADHGETRVAHSARGA